MARYCFYCGRELISGEKCGCRSASRGSRETDRASDSQPEQTRSGSNSAPQKTGKKSFWQRFNAFLFPVSQRAAKPHRPLYRQKSAQAKNRPSASADTRTGRLLLRQLLAYLTRPADSINQPDRQLSTPVSLLLLLLAGLLGGFFLIVSMRQPQLQQFISLNHITLSAGAAASSQAFLFFQGFGIGLTLFLLPALLYHLVLRISLRYTVSLPGMITQLNPAYFYAELFITAALLVLPGSVFSAVFLLAASLAAASLAQFLIIRRLTSFDENRCFMLVAFVLIIYTGIAAFLLNLSLPVLHALLDQSVVI